VAAVAGGALESRYGQVVFAGLVLSWFGDVFLVSRSEKLFLAGLVSFLLAHVAYMGAFLSFGVQWTGAAAALVVVVPVGALVLRWFYPKVPTDMRAPVIAYVTVISLMVTLSVGAVAAGGTAAMAAAAVVFYASDIFVARDRFVEPGLTNTILGLPMYYGGQLVFAYTAAWVSALSGS
jgi:uncharacterized membrane protein YhhN